MARRSNKLTAGLLQPLLSNQTESFEVCVQVFLRECKIRNLSEHTVQYYRIELTKFMKRLERAGIDTAPSKITGNMLKEHVILRMCDEGLKETTINANLRAIRAFFNYLENEALITKNPMEKIKLLKQKKAAIATFSREEIMRLFGQVDKTTFTGIRDYTMMMFLLETGVRVKEICGIRINDITFQDGFVTIKEAKGYKERNVPIQTTMKKQLALYLQIRGNLEHDILFVNIDNDPFRIRTVQQTIRRYGQRAGITNVRCSPHTFRHTFAKMSVQNGADVFTLQTVLGHTTMDMVRNYVNLFSSEICKNHRKFSPVEKLF